MSEYFSKRQTRRNFLRESRTYLLPAMLPMEFHTFYNRESDQKNGTVEEITEDIPRDEMFTPEAFPVKEWNDALVNMPWYDQEYVRTPEIQDPFPEMPLYTEISKNPINLAIFASSITDIHYAYTHAGFVRADRITVTNIAHAFFADESMSPPDSSYPTQPVSLLFVVLPDGRIESQTVAFEREVHEHAATRHHVRIYRTGRKYQYMNQVKELYLGAASFDEGFPQYCELNGVFHDSTVSCIEYGLPLHSVEQDVRKERLFEVSALTRLKNVRPLGDFKRTNPILLNKGRSGHEMKFDGVVTGLVMI